MSPRPSYAVAVTFMLMLMLNPEVDQQYWFVHPNSPHIAHTPSSAAAAAAAAVARPIPVWYSCDETNEQEYIQSFVRSSDGGSYVFGCIYENHPDAWQQALADLYENGYFEVEEAREAGLIPPNWEVLQAVRDLHEYTTMRVVWERAQEHNRRCRQIAGAGPVCPHCGRSGRSDKIRSRDLTGYFICNACARSFGHDNLDAIETLRPVVVPAYPADPSD